MTQRQSKAAKLRGFMAAGDWPRALSLAAKFPDLGEFKPQITRAHGCITNPRFFQQVGVDCAAAIEEGKAALLSRYGA